MLKNYILIALRNLVRNKLYSVINIGGLALGLAVCMGIFLFVQDELSFDKWIKGADKIYRMETEYPTRDTKMAISPGRLRDTLVEVHSDKIDTMSRLYRESFIIKSETKDVGAERNFFGTVSFVDSNFFEIFDLDIISGDRARLFDGKNGVVISETIAEKYFGDQPPLGKTLVFDEGDLILTVVAVMKDIPENSHFDIDFLAFFDTERYVDQPWIAQDWLSANVHSYIKVKGEEDARLLEQALPDFLDKYAMPEDGSYKPNEVIKLNLVSLQDIHLHSTGKSQHKTPGSILIVYGFSAIAVLILFIASVNFMNLSTARASIRAKEIALRKVLGAERKQLILQFLGEALVTTLAALLVALALVELSLPWYSDLIDKQLTFQNLYNSEILAMISLMVFVVTFGAGLYPAFVLSSFRPGKTLHGGGAKPRSSGKLRSLLVVMQFSISIGLIIMTGIVYEQLDYARTRDMGFNKDHKLMLRNMAFPGVKEIAQSLRQEIEKIPGVLQTTFSGRKLPLRGYSGRGIELPNASADEHLPNEAMTVDFNFLEVYGAKLIAGRHFSEDLRGDLPILREGGDLTSEATQSVIISRKAATILGFESPEQAVGKTLKVTDRLFGDIKIASTIVGVVEDMYLRSLRDRVDSMIFYLREDNFGVLHIDVSGENMTATLAAIDRVWNDRVTALPVRRSFVDEDFDAFYQADQKRGKVFAYFAALAVLVSCLGLYGLAAFTAEQRTKEIGVRKVLGASVVDIVKLLVWQFSKPVLLANLLAWPVSYYFMRDYLDGFEYRIDIHPGFFITASLGALLIAWVTVTWHAAKVARAKPITALRYE